MFPIQLNGPSIALREMTVEDGIAILDIVRDPHVHRYLYIPEFLQEAAPGDPTPLKDPIVFEREALEEIKERVHAVPRLRFQLTAVERASGEVLGLGNITLTDPMHLVAEVGYVLRQDRWGNGFATEIASLLVTFGFTDLHLHRIWAGHHPDNPASGRVLQKVGMTREGQFRESKFSHGAWRDSVIYSILEPEWKSSASGDGR